MINGFHLNSRLPAVFTAQVERCFDSFTVGRVSPG